MFSWRLFGRETELYYNLFRYYDSNSERLTQQDPIGLAGGENLCAYAPNPLGWVDPLGLDYSVWQIHSPDTTILYKKDFIFMLQAMWSYQLGPITKEE
nr:RHS repeat-associated core domain-containing protein [Pectobacterium brasiliense]